MAKAEDSFRITPNEIAEEIGISAKRVRSVMRGMTAKDDRPGSGGRWVIDSPEMADAIRRKCVETHGRKATTFRPKSDD